MVKQVSEDAIWKRVHEIWNHRDLKTMSFDEHEALALELREINRQHGIGGESVFREMCAKIMKANLDQAIQRINEIMAMDARAMTPSEKLKLGCEIAGINAKFKAMGHDCELGTLLDALEALRANLRA